MTPYVEQNPREGMDEWGCEWANIGTCMKGEVKNPPLKDLNDFFDHPLPSLTKPGMWTPVEQARERNPDRYLIGMGGTLYERIHLLAGLEETWMAIASEPELVGQVVDRLVDFNIQIAERYAAADYDGFFMLDDWGVQDRLMIHPESWRNIWKPRYARLFSRVHELGLHTFLHSCGYILAILGDLIEAGLDVIQMDQQQNMGLDQLSAFAGRITFYSPVDIQRTMVTGSADEIRAYAREMVLKLGTPKGGFIPKMYGDPVGAGHSQAALDTMFDEFLKIRNQDLNAFYMRNAQ